MTPVLLPFETMQAQAEQACRLLRVLGNPDRLRILCLLSQEGELCVREIEGALGIVQPTLSQQLGVLREESLVSTRREGKNIHYRIDSAQAAAVIDVLYQQYCIQPKE